jgi:hypothetical protein
MIGEYIHELMNLGLPKQVIVPITYDSSYLHIVTRNITTKDYMSKIPPLIRRGVCESKHHSKLLNFFSPKRFGEDVYNFLICGTTSQVNCLSLSMILNQVILFVDVLCSIMESRILSNLIAKLL